MKLLSEDIAVGLSMAIFSMLILSSIIEYS